jgi:tagatose 6-phosphate kinase
MIICLGTTPAVQRVMVFRQLTLDAVNRAAVTKDGVAGKSVNVAKVLRALGGSPLATGFLGGEYGQQVRAALEDRGIAHEFIPVATPTRQCVTVIDEATGQHTELVEESRAVEPADYDALREALRRLLPGSQALVMSGTLTPEGPVDLYAWATHLAHEEGALTVVDAQGAALRAALGERPGLVKPNRAELAATLGLDLPDEAAVIEAMRGLAKAGAQRVVVTAGAAPTLAFDGRDFWRVIAPTVKAVNPIGSGDAFTAGLVARLVHGDTLGEACRWGCAAGAANALTLMAGEVALEDARRLADMVQLEKMAQ